MGCLFGGRVFEIEIGVEIGIGNVNAVDREFGRVRGGQRKCLGQHHSRGWSGEKASNMKIVHWRRNVT